MFWNSRAAGSVSVTKTDKNTGAPLSGVHFKLTDRSGVLVQEGDTDVNGKLSFTAIPLGEYLIQETSALSGYVLNETPISVSLTQNGQVVELSVQNDPVIGSLTSVFSRTTELCSRRALRTRTASLSSQIFPMGRTTITRSSLFRKAMFLMMQSIPSP